MPLTGFKDLGDKGTAHSVWAGVKVRDEGTDVLHRGRHIGQG